VRISCAYVDYRWDDIYKIGATGDLMRRYQAKRSRDGLKIMECDRPMGFERELHGFLAFSRIDLKNEQFHMSPEEALFVSMLMCSDQCPACKSRRWGK